MKKLLNGIVDFRKNVRPTIKDTFALLALGQRPDTLFIACSDSRVVPNLFASTEPGDLFVIRNVRQPDSALSGHEPRIRARPPPSNSASPRCPSPKSSSAVTLSVARSPRSSKGEGQPADAPAFNCWLRHGAGSLRKLEAGAHLGDHLERHNQLSQLNVLEQLEHLKTYPVVQERLAAGQLRLHGWYFDIKEANVYEYEPSEARFHLIDETYAATLLNRDRQRP